LNQEFNQRYASASEALKSVRNLKLGGKMLDFKSTIGAGALLFMIMGGGWYYWRLEISLHTTSEVEIFEEDQTQFPSLYRNDADGLQMEYPSSWQLTKSEQSQGTVAMFEPEVDQSYLTTPQVKIEIAQSNGQSLEQYTTDAAYQITQLPQAKIIDSRPIEFAAGDGHKIIYTSINPDNNLEQKYLQIWTIKGDRVYKMTYQATTDDYPNFAETVEQQMFQSVQIKSE
jgi:eukaryotic-like serine/threonine-protein kinase